MEFIWDEVSVLLTSSSSNSSTVVVQENLTAPFFVEVSCAGSSFLISSIGVYLNLVLARSLFKSTLLATSHRRTIRFFAYLHICLALFLNLTSACWLLRFITWPILPMPTVLFIGLRGAARNTLVWCLFERFVYNQNEKVREDKVGRLIIFIRLGVMTTVMATTCVFSLIIGDCDPDALIPHVTFVFELAASAALPFPMLIILLMMLAHIGKKHKMSHGLVAANRAKKLELERAAIRDCILPLLLFMSIMAGIELLIFYMANYLYTPLTFLLYSCRVVIYPLSHVVMQPLLREDCRMNLFLWRKLQRRSSEARVRTIMNKESQESIISNFKMIGILSE